MDPYQPITTTCQNSLAVVFHTPKHVLDQQEAALKASEAEAENAKLKAILVELIAAQSATVKSKLSEDALALGGTSEEPELP